MATLAMLATCVVLVWSAVSLRSNGVGGKRTTYTVGDTFANLQGIDFGAAPATLVLFVRSGCKYCTASAGFYRRLGERADRIPMIAIGFEPEETLRAYLYGLSVRPDRIISVSRGSLHLSATPTLLLVSSKRKIERLWVGQLRSPDRETDVLESTRLRKP